MKKGQPGYKDAKGIIYCGFDGKGILAEGTTVPTDGATGYAPGCIFFKRAGTVGGQNYINEGTTSSCDFNPVTTAQTLTTGAGIGITAGTGTVYKNSVQRLGALIYTTIYIDLTGLGTSTTDLDVIGVAGGPATLGQITTAQNGAIESVRMTCLELPATGADDIDLYSATVGTAVFDDGIAALTETAIITSGGAWANGTVKGATTVPPANDYLYLVNGEAGTVGTYTAGKFLIELFGY